MAFQIRDKEGIAIGLKVLDQEAATFWGKELDPKYYACPANGTKQNWFDSIGYHIDTNGAVYHKRYDKITWLMVKESLMLCITNILTITPEELLQNKEYWKLTFDLIDYWEAKGYTPHKVE